MAEARGVTRDSHFFVCFPAFKRRPYDIGDRIAVSDPEKDTSSNGSTTWFVEDLGLYSTVRGWSWYMYV